MKSFLAVSRFLPVLIIVVMANFSCKEHLPAYKNPSEVFDGSLQPVYLYTQTENYLAVYLTVVNTYDETFEGRALFDGSIEIIFARDPTRKRTYYLSAENVIRARKYNTVSKVLTFDPGDSVRLGVKWNFVDDSSYDLRENVFNYLPDVNCRNRHIAASESFIIRGNVKIYRETAVVEPQSVIAPLCHVRNWVSSKECPLLLPEDACTSRKP